MTDPKFPPRTTLYFKMGNHKPYTIPAMNSVAVPMISLSEHEHLIREARDALLTEPERKKKNEQPRRMD